MKFNRISGEFTLAADEAAYLDAKQGQTRSQLAFTLAFYALFYVLFSVTDLAALGPVPAAWQLLAARLAVAVTAGCCAWVVWRRPLSVRATRLAAIVAETVALGCFMLVVVLRPTEMHWHAMSLALMLAVIYLYIPNRLWHALALAGLSTAVFIAIAQHVSHMRFADTLTMGMLMVLANTFGVLAARRLNRIAREEFRSQVALRHAAERDHLTGCYNRRYLHEHLMGNELARAERFAHSLTVLLCDIDHFKRINDTHGHADGDAVLRSFAVLLKSLTREHVDSVVRYGGEEFLAVLPETDLAGGVRLAERLRSAFAATATRSIDGSASLRTTASFGVATVDFARAEPGYTLGELISSADKMMYHAKRNGRNRVEALQIW
ncbi:GGDEF domain-containing protein [Massilia sp. TN1-12]|uniref:GGDEF domain-containing protein n=1 Tax=Massilia paldalensis TaxID=3377675 RepID=UPI00384EE51C